VTPSLLNLHAQVGQVTGDLRVEVEE
jgi:hypothetical protein